MDISLTSLSVFVAAHSVRIVVKVDVRLEKAVFRPPTERPSF